MGKTYFKCTKIWQIKVDLKGFKVSTCVFWHILKDRLFDGVVSKMHHPLLHVQMTLHTTAVIIQNIPVGKTVDWFLVDLSAHISPWTETWIFWLFCRKIGLFQVKGLKSKWCRESLMSKVTCEQKVFFFFVFLFRLEGNRFDPNF